MSAEAFRPSSERYGSASGDVFGCGACGHGAVVESIDPSAVSRAYAGAVDEVSLRERAGQVATANRGLARIEAVVRPGRILDVGCWTGSFLVAARDRGWAVKGVEPSGWAASVAAKQGIDVTNGELDAIRDDREPFTAVAMCDVLEHLAEPGKALAVAARLLEPRGALYVTVPDAGSVLARFLGRRWWSVLPMHLQYFTRTSMVVLLARHGFGVVHMGTHPKAFTARYYAERIGGYASRLGEFGEAALEAVGFADRLVAPDFRDRMEVIAVRR